MSAKKIRFRGDLSFQNRIDELLEETTVVDGETPRRSSRTFCMMNNDSSNPTNESKEDSEASSFMDFFKLEITRGYLLEHDEERYMARRKKIYSFLRIPRDLERFMVYGIMQCADSFLYIHTFLPLRFALAVWGLVTRPLASCLGLRRRTQRLLTPAEICDLLKGSIWIAVTMLMLLVDTNRVYHIIKSQSIIKLYLFYNMLEVGDRLLAAFGQDTIDALFWTATDTKKSKREHFGLVPHILFTLIYVALHSALIMFQATTLNVAVNSNNKGLLTIMISNNFVELKGSVFKKFDKNNLFQLTCSDVRERFHLTVLLFVVMIQTMKEFDWSFNQFCIMLPDCLTVLFTEMLIDWIKHAFITRFNELPECIYREYTTSLAYDMTQTRQKHAFSDHSDLLARRMGFIPFPLSVVLIKAIYSAVPFNNLAAWVLFSLVYAFALGLRICLTVCALGKACKLMKEHHEEKCNSSTPSSMTNVPPVTAVNTNTATMGMPGVENLPGSPVTARPKLYDVSPTTHVPSSGAATNYALQKSVTADMTTKELFNISAGTNTTPQQQQISKTSQTTSCNSAPGVLNKSKSVVITTSPNSTLNLTHTNLDVDVKSSLELGATALFSNSDVDLDDVCLNEHVLDNSTSVATGFVDEAFARSEPDLQQTSSNSTTSTNLGNSVNTATTKQTELRRRTHKRSESEPSMQMIVGATLDSSESQA